MLLIIHKYKKLLKSTERIQMKCMFCNEKFIFWAQTRWNCVIQSSSLNAWSEISCTTYRETDTSDKLEYCESRYVVILFFFPSKHLHTLRLYQQFLYILSRWIIQLSCSCPQLIPSTYYLFVLHLLTMPFYYYFMLLPVLVRAHRKRFFKSQQDLKG